MDVRWPEYAEDLRRRIRETLILPEEPCDLEAEVTDTLDACAHRIEKVTYASEPGSRVTALLYLPNHAKPPHPAVLLAFGHGGSKSCLYGQYAGQLYAALGYAVLIPDVIGEEERHFERRMGTRAHDMTDRTPEERLRYSREVLRRTVLGKIILDVERGFDYLESRNDIDGSRMGMMGYSLGGDTTGMTTGIDLRVKCCAICGWGFTPQNVRHGKTCTNSINNALRSFTDYNEQVALCADHAATGFFNGTNDTVIDHSQTGEALVRGVRASVAGARQILEDAEIPHALEAFWTPCGCHRPYFLSPNAARWFRTHQPVEDGPPIPERTMRFGDWYRGQGQEEEKLYGTEERHFGAEVIDVGAVYRDPAELACLPLEALPPPEYTFAGWCALMEERNRPISSQGRLTNRT